VLLFDTGLVGSSTQMPVSRKIGVNSSSSHKERRVRPVRLINSGVLTELMLVTYEGVKPMWEKITKM